MPYKLSKEDQLCGVTYFDVDKHYSPIPKATCADIKGKCDNSPSTSNVIPFDCKGKTKEEILKELDAMDAKPTDKKEDKEQPTPKPTPATPETPKPAENTVNKEELDKDLNDFISNFDYTNHLGFLDRDANTFTVPGEMEKVYYISQLKQALSQNEKLKDFTYEITITDFTELPSTANSIGETLEVSVYKDGAKVTSLSHQVGYNENLDHL